MTRSFGSVMVLILWFAGCGAAPELAGRVVGPDGGPVAGARIEVYAVPEPWQRPPLERVVEWPRLDDTESGQIV